MKNPDEMTDEEVKLLIARENLKRYGNPLGPPSGEVDPRFALPSGQAQIVRVVRDPRAHRADALDESATVVESALVVKRSKAKAKVTRVAPAPKKRMKRVIDPKWFELTKRCPNCKKTKNIGTDFGVVIRRDVETPAGWCKQCRSLTNYRARARKNKSVHHDP